MKKEKEKQKIYVKFGIWPLCIGMVVVGVLFILISGIDYKQDKAIWKYIFDIMNILGTTILSAGLVSIALEISTINNMIKNAINGVLNADFPVDAYSNKNLDKLSLDIASQRANVDREFLSKSVYSLEEKLLECTKSIYYDYHKAKYHISKSRDGF